METSTNAHIERESLQYLSIYINSKFEDGAGLILDLNCVLYFFSDILGGTYMYLLLIIYGRIFRDSLGNSSPFE